MSADRSRVRRAVAVLAATATIALMTPAPAHADTTGTVCKGIGIAIPFGDVVCKAVASAPGAVSSAISFAEDPLGYLQQHLTAASNAVLAGLIDQTGKS